jgi:RNA polymerase sigma-70 factor (ECF subfamily)
MTSADQFQGNCSVRTWLCTIARNLYCDHLKKAESRTQSLENAPEPASSEDLERKLEDADTAMRIHRMLHKLDEPYREVFTLRVFAELKFDEIGSVFGKSGNWAGVTYYRAKQKLLQMLKEEDLV